jgi:serine/threonine-protein kinase HipA
MHPGWQYYRSVIFLFKRDTNDFAMLERIGGACVGAVSLLPEGTAPTGPKSTRHRELTEPEIRQIMAELPRRPLMVGTEDIFRHHGQ